MLFFNGEAKMTAAAVQGERSTYVYSKLLIVNCE